MPNDKHPAQAFRMLDEMRNLLYDKNFAAAAPDEKLYLMNRDVLHRINDCLRYDETTIFSKKLGREFNKTHGHEHICSELYEILGGTGYFLLQKRNNDKISEAYIVPANPGDIIYIPPQYGHIIINTGNKDLKTANIVCDKYQSDYRGYKHFHGAGYYAIESNGAVEWEKNPNFNEVAELQSKTPKRTIQSAELSLPKITLKQMHQANPEILIFLK